MNNNQDIDSKKDLNKNKTNTTGHKWDDISEYDIPAPRWWLIIWIISIIWAIIYWVLYPAWPTISGNSKGSLNWSKFSQLSKEQENKQLAWNDYIDKINKMTFDEIKNNDDLYQFALNGGKVAFKENCAACHGSGAAGAKGYPNLNDDDWLWGGKLEDIYTTLLYGIRSGHDKARANQMPSFGKDKILTKDQINQVIDYITTLSNATNNYNQDQIAGQKIFQGNCASCHGVNGEGNQIMGAPRLNDKIWLYGNDKKDLYQTIFYARAGVMPYWINRLDNATIKELALFVHSLGGGEPSDKMSK
jgi:cytochrome c oxidase cbb3-type subunit 3